MGTKLQAVLLIVVTSLLGSSCSPTEPNRPTASIVIRAPASIAPRVCARCPELAGELEAVAQLVIEETAGVGVDITSMTTHLAGNGGNIEGPGTFDPATILRFGVPTTRVNARGSLTIQEIGVHFAQALRARLPGTLRFTFVFRDDNGHTITSEVVIQVSS
jgi:hypothetical protein